MNSRKSKAYTDYLYPQALRDGGVVAMKRGIGDIEKFVVLKNGREEKQFTPGFVNDAGMLSVADSKIVWSEYGYDPRWGVRNYSLVKVYDMAADMRWVVGGKHERLSGAALSPDGKRIVAIRSGNDYRNSLLILDVYTGKKLNYYSAPDDEFYSMPRWSDDGEKIVFLKTE